MSASDKIFYMNKFTHVMACNHNFSLSRALTLLVDLRRGGGTATGGGSLSPAGEQPTLALSGDVEELLVTSSSERKSPIGISLGTSFEGTGSSKGSSVLRR